MIATRAPDKNLSRPPVLGCEGRAPLTAVVVGGGPAGLRAAEVIASAGVCRVALYDQKASVGRKFLVAGRGGLNLTHSEELSSFIERYGADRERWSELLAGFGPTDMRTWAESLDVETYIGTSGRVFPKGQQAAVLLRRWVSRLRTLQVEFHVSRRLESLRNDQSGRWQLNFKHLPTEQMETAYADVVVLALGGASWPQTGSDGSWPALFSGVFAPRLNINPWQAANCGWECAWDLRLLAVAEGKPLKNIQVSAGGRTAAGEALITRYGLEGGVIYQLGAELRAMQSPEICIDLKPQMTVEGVWARLPSQGLPAWGHIARRLKLSDAALALLEFHGPATGTRDHPALAAAVKSLSLQLKRPRPIAEAISSAGGLDWNELEEDLMLRRLPGVFAAGEMIDWEAPTGGYLLQGSFATGTRAGQGALRALSARVHNGPAEVG